MRTVERNGQNNRWKRKREQFCLTKEDYETLEKILRRNAAGWGRTKKWKVLQTEGEPEKTE